MASKPKSVTPRSYKARPAQKAEQFRAELEQNIRTFEVATRTSFLFLETEYGFERRAIEGRDFEDLRDAVVVVPYCGARVAVHVSYALIDARVHAAIIELENGRMPERVSFWGDAGYARAVTADSYAAMMSGGNIPPVLPEPNPRKPRIGVVRAADMRRAELRTKMAGVVRQVAERVKTFCAPLLKGDTSMFAAVQQFHKQRYS